MDHLDLVVQEDQADPAVQVGLEDQVDLVDHMGRVAQEDQGDRPDQAVLVVLGDQADQAAHSGQVAQADLVDRGDPVDRLAQVGQGDPVLQVVQADHS